MAPKTFQLEGESLFNGVRDTEGGIWLRIRDEQDRRMGHAAIAKQIKNRDAATGTLTALDPDSPHLLDYMADSLQRLLDGFNGARPSSAQLDGTPMGNALAADEKKGKRTRGKGSATKIGDVVGAATSDIEWSKEVPKPRPRAGEFVWRTFDEIPREISAVLGYVDERKEFDVICEGETVPVKFDASHEVWQDAALAGAPREAVRSLSWQSAFQFVEQLRELVGKLPDSVKEALFHEIANRVVPLIAKADKNAKAKAVAQIVDELAKDASNARSLETMLDANIERIKLDRNIGTGDESTNLVDHEEEPTADVGDGPATVRSAAELKQQLGKARKKPAAKAAKPQPKRKR